MLLSYTNIYAIYNEKQKYHKWKYIVRVMFEKEGNRNSKVMTMFYFLNRVVCI